MSFKIKNALVKRDNLDESFQLIDSENYFGDEEVLVAIDSDVLVGIEVLLKTIFSNDFKNWNKIKNQDINSFQDLLLNLGYSAKEINYILKSI
ncbi:MAG: hypothetical protein LBV42_04670 [Methanobrevibacter sp.]|jgi:hypothetical protein|nr:hypothetical protein [Methanobrevibacter sp.]